MQALCEVLQQQEEERCYQEKPGQRILFLLWQGTASLNSIRFVWDFVWRTVMWVLAVPISVTSALRDANSLALLTVTHLRFLCTPFMSQPFLLQPCTHSPPLATCFSDSSFIPNPQHFFLPSTTLALENRNSRPQMSFFWDKKPSCITQNKSQVTMLTVETLPVCIPRQWQSYQAISATQTTTTG